MKAKIVKRNGRKTVGKARIIKKPKERRKLHLKNLT